MFGTIVTYIHTLCFQSLETVLAFVFILHKSMKLTQTKGLAEECEDDLSQKNSGKHCDRAVTKRNKQ